MFTWWLSQLGPAVIGNLNHAKRWLTGFQASLIQACQVGTASSLHAVLPATGMPSFLSRIIDVVSIDSQSLLPVIHIYTTVEGKLSWSLLECPCLENIETSQEKGVAVAVGTAGTAPKRWFGFHSAEQMIKVWFGHNYRVKIEGLDIAGRSSFREGHAWSARRRYV